MVLSKIHIYIITVVSYRKAFTIIYKQCITHPKKKKKGRRNVHGVQQSQNAALPRHQEEEETDKTKQAQIEQTYEKH